MPTLEPWPRGLLALASQRSTIPVSMLGESSLGHKQAKAYSLSCLHRGHVGSPPCTGTVQNSTLRFAGAHCTGTAERGASERLNTGKHRRPGPLRGSPSLWPGRFPLLQAGGLPFQRALESRDLQRSLSGRALHRRAIFCLDSSPFAFCLPPSTFRLVPGSPLVLPPCLCWDSSTQPVFLMEGPTLLLSVFLLPLPRSAVSCQADTSLR